MSLLNVQVFSILVCLIAFVFAIYMFFWVKKQPSDNVTIKRIGKLIQDGARTFLKREYKVLAWFSGICAILILLFLPKPIWQGMASLNITMCIAYLAGTCISAVAGKIGIEVATVANTKAAEAAKNGIRPSFLTGFRGRVCHGNGSSRCKFTWNYNIIYVYKRYISYFRI